MADQSKEYTVVQAFTGYKGDGSGEQEYFTAGNQHLAAEYLSAEELQYRVDKGFMLATDKVTPAPRVTGFVAPVEELAPAPVSAGSVVSPARRPAAPAISPSTPKVEG